MCEIKLTNIVLDSMGYFRLATDRVCCFGWFCRNTPLAHTSSGAVIWWICDTSEWSADVHTFDKFTRAPANATRLDNFFLPTQYWGWPVWNALHNSCLVARAPDFWVRVPCRTFEKVQRGLFSLFEKSCFTCGSGSTCCKAGMFGDINEPLNHWNWLPSWKSTVNRSKEIVHSF